MGDMTFDLNSAAEVGQPDHHPIAIQAVEAARIKIERRCAFRSYGVIGKGIVMDWVIQVLGDTNVSNRFDRKRTCIANLKHRSHRFQLAKASLSRNRHVGNKSFLSSEPRQKQDYSQHSYPGLTPACLGLRNVELPRLSLKNDSRPFLMSLRHLNQSPLRK